MYTTVFISYTDPPQTAIVTVFKGAKAYTIHYSLKLHLPQEKKATLNLQTT